MDTLTIRIDPAIPLCWEDTDTLRFGFDSAEVRLTNPPARVQRFIARLRTGIPSDRIGAASHEAGLKASERHTLIERLAPVLRYEDPTASEHLSRSLTVALLGEGALLDKLSLEVSLAGHRPVTIAQASAFSSETVASADVAVILERYLGELNLARHLETIGIPHIAARFTDRSLLVGPLVLPGAAPCLACVALYDLASDPNASVCAAQLSDVPPGAESRESCGFAATLVSSAIARWQSGSGELLGARLRYPVHDGLPSPFAETEFFSQHPECGCALQPPLQTSPRAAAQIAAGEATPLRN